MAKDPRRRGASDSTSANRSSREAAAPVRNGDARTTESWLKSVVFGTIEAKTPVNIRLDADVVRYFRAGGAGYQTRINEVLRAFVAARLKAGDLPGAPPKSAANGGKRRK